MESDQRTRHDEQEFRKWLQRGPENQAEYDRHLALWRGAGALADNDEARELLRFSRADSRAETSRKMDRRRMLGGFALAAAASLVAVFVFPAWETGDTIYRTLPGEQRRIPLSDGSTVIVNTNSSLRIAFSSGERRLFLDRGQAHFEVAKDALRPFRVFVGNDEVRAIGTAFDVRREGNFARVTLEHGRIALFRDTQTGARRSVSESNRPVAILRPGEAAVLAPSTPVKLVMVDLRQTEAWRYGRMILDSAPLGDAVADINRYGGKRIVLADPSLNDLRISGVFQTGNPEAFVDSVSAILPVELARSESDSLILKAR